MAATTKNNYKMCSTPLACKLTSAALRERKATLLAKLQKELVEKKELSNGYSFKFQKGDAMKKELNEFMISEKECFEFFDFKLTDSDDKNFVWLDFTEPDGAKELITTELGLSSIYTLCISLKSL